jgi:hypothetical protein
MAAPNMANVVTIIGKTDVASLTTTLANLVVNSAASGNVIKVNTVLVSNVDGTNSADTTVNLVRSATSYALAHTITVPPDSTLVVVSKDNSVYLEEGDLIQASASATGDLQAIVSYEVISD